MQLIVSATSPYARRARIVVLEKDIPCDITSIVVWENPAIVTQNNPLRKIPILITDDGTHLVGASLICDYLDQLDNNPIFIPPARRWAVRAQEALIDGATDAALSIIMAGKVAPDLQNPHPDWQNWLLTKTHNVLVQVESQIASANPDTPTIADIALACMIDFLQRMKPAFLQAEKYPNLMQWHTTITQRQSFIDTQLPK